MPFMRYENNEIIVGEFESVLACVDFTYNGPITGTLFGKRRQIKVKKFKRSQQRAADLYMEQLHKENKLVETYKAKWVRVGSSSLQTKHSGAP